MRAIIRVKTNNQQLNQLTLEGFLQSESWVVVDLERDKEWLMQVDQRPIKDKIDVFFNSIVKQETKDSDLLCYIYNPRAEGLISFRNDGFYEIRIYKHKKDALLGRCEELVESLVNFFERDKTQLNIQTISIRERNESVDTIVGEVFKTEASKIRKAQDEKNVEYRTSIVLFVCAFICVVSSFLAGYQTDYKVETLNNVLEWLVYFLERITGPLLITGGVLFINYWLHRQKTLANKSVIVWK